MSCFVKPLTTSTIIANGQNWLMAALPRNGSGEKTSEPPVNSMNRSSGAAIGGNQRWRRVMKRSKAKARIEHARNMDDKAMLTSGIVTPSIVNRRTALPSLICSDCTEVELKSTTEMVGGGIDALRRFQISDRKTIIEKIGVKSFFKR